MNFLWFFFQYLPHSATYQTCSKFSREFNGDIHFLLETMWLKKIGKNLIIEQHLYEYKKAPLQIFTFWQISSELIFVHPWIVELGSVIKVKPGVTRGPLCCDRLNWIEVQNVGNFTTWIIRFWNIAWNTSV